MPRITYTVCAFLPDEATATEYLDWLLSGHIQHVIDAGALTGAAARVLDPSTPIRVEARYFFSNKQAYEAYLHEHAPALRAEGLARFPASRGIRFERSVALSFRAGESPGQYSGGPVLSPTPSPSPDRGPHAR